MSTIESLSKKRSWVEMAIDDDYQELEERVIRQEERIKLMLEYIKKIIEIRRFLVSIGEYEFEDGEIL
jgi:hypothetical protein